MPFSQFPSLTNQIECPHSPFLRYNYTNFFNIAFIDFERSVVVSLFLNSMTDSDWMTNKDPGDARTKIELI